MKKSMTETSMTRIKELAMYWVLYAGIMTYDGGSDFKIVAYVCLFLAGIIMLVRLTR